MSNLLCKEAADNGSKLVEIYLIEVPDCESKLPDFYFNELPESGWMFLLI